MPKSLEDLWERLRSLPGLFPEGLGDAPWVYLVAGAALFGVVFFLTWRFALRRSDSVSRELWREIRERRREGDFLGMGQRYETLGKFAAAKKAYARGGLHEELAALLLREGRREEAKQVARDGEVWVLYGDLCREDEDFEEAAAAYERASKLYDAARAWEDAGRAFKAARTYVAVGMEYNAVKLLVKGEGRATAEALETALRSSLAEARGRSMSPDMVLAVRRAAQLWLEEGETERAYRLAADAEQWETAVPIARDYLEPDPDRAEVCARAGAHLAAAEIYHRLGDARKEAFHRGEHHQRRDEPADAARCFEAAEDWSRAAEQWALAGDPGRAAELYGRVEEFEQAAQLYAALGDEAGRRAMLDAARSRDPRRVLEAEEATLRMRPQAARDVDPTAPAPADDRYVLEKEVGRGGVGVVYRAYDAVLQRTVAYKVLSREVTGDVHEPADLMKEARAAARLSHPNIVQIYDAGKSRDGFFVVMEYVEGENFARLLKKRRLSVQGAVTVGRQICAALEHAHQRRIVHRDLKPSNLIWTSENQVKLTDFGLARFFEGSMDKILTRPAGTPFYMAPEQIRGDPVDARTDLYSLGCVLYELLCNRAPFSGGGSSIYHHLSSPPTDPRRDRREIPEELAVIILQCLEKDPARRPPSAADVGRRLAALAEPTTGSTPSTGA